MSGLYQKALRSSADHAIALLAKLRADEEDYEELETSYKSALENRRQLFGDALFLDLESTIEIANIKGDLTENEKTDLVRCVEMINLATFAFHVFYGMETDTCLSAFFRTFAPFFDEYSPEEMNIYTILRKTLFRQRVNASNNIDKEISSIIDITFPAENFTTCYFRADAPHNKKTIEKLLEIRNEVLKIPVEMLDPEEFSNEDEVRDKLREFIEFRCDKFGCDIGQGSEKTDEVEKQEELTIQDNNKTHNTDEYQDKKPQVEQKQTRKRMATSPSLIISQIPEDQGERPSKRLATSPRSDWSQTSDEEEDDDDEDEDTDKQPRLTSPNAGKPQTPVQEEQAHQRSIFSPHPDAHVLSPVEAGFEEDATSLNNNTEVDELEHSLSPNPSTHSSFEQSQNTQTSPSLLRTKSPISSSLEPTNTAANSSAPNEAAVATEMSSTSQGISTQRSQGIAAIKPITTYLERKKTTSHPVQPSSFTSQNVGPSTRERPNQHQSSSRSVVHIPDDVDRTQNPPVGKFENKGGRIQAFPKIRKEKVPWTDEEVRALEEGVALQGTQWEKILRGDNRLRAHIATQLKDKATNEIKRRLKHGLALGGFSVIYKPERKY